MNKLAPSILSADFSDLKHELNRISSYAHYLHIDVMDGAFVPSITIGEPVIQKLRAISSLVFDVHLMVTNPEKHISSFAQAGSDIITFHYEASKNPIEVIKQIKSHNIRAAVSVKPETDIRVIEHLLPMLDMVLIMSVEPGQGGQKFIESSLEKAMILNEMRERQSLSFDIEMDGGINKHNIKKVIASGVNVVVVGSAIFSAENPTQEAKWFFENIV